MLQRRTFLLAAAPWLAAPAGAARPQAASGPLRCGADPALSTSGLARALQLGFGRDTGLAIEIVVAPALALLEAAARGDVDVLLCNAPEAEKALEAQGLVHDRRPVAAGDFVLVGPAGSARMLPRGLGAASAMTRLAALADAGPTRVRFLSANDGSGVHLAEQRLWREAQVSPAPPWHVAAEPSIDFVGQVRQASAWALVERGAWLARGGGGVSAAGATDPLLAEPVHVMRSFHASHPAGKFFSSWAGGAHGRAIARGHRGYRVAA